MNDRIWVDWTEKGEQIYCGFLPNKQDFIRGTGFIRQWDATTFSNDGIDGSSCQDVATNDARYVALGLVRQLHGIALMNLTAKQLQFVWILAYHRIVTHSSYGKRGASMGIGYNITRGTYSSRYHAKLRFTLHCSAIHKNGTAAIELHRWTDDKYGNVNGQERTNMFALSSDGIVLGTK